MERALPLLTAAILLAALTGCSAGAVEATVPPAAERELTGGSSTPGEPLSGSSSPQDRPTGAAKARIVVGAGGTQRGHGAYVCKLIGSSTIGLSSAKNSNAGSGLTLALAAAESGTTVLELPAGENNLATYCTDPGGVGPNFTGTSAAFVVTEGGSTDVVITAAPRP